MKEGFYSSSVRRHSGSRAVSRATGHNKPAPWNAGALRAGTLRHTPSTLPITSGLGQILACKLIRENNASTVAIDNKIEQAMDLVKSHLMFAVREEVEILKENIKELTEKNNLLMEKNTQLELENSILRNAAAPETLAQLASSSSTTQQQQQQQPPPTSSS